MITIREEQHQDIHPIHEVNIQAFGQNQEADLVDKIRKSSNDLISLVAVVHNTIVGHIFFSPVTIESIAKKTIRGMGLAPMAVLPAFHYSIRCEWDVPDTAFMILLLDESQMRESAGLAQYLPEFAEAM